jgi:hypothetical protein
VLPVGEQLAPIVALVKDYTPELIDDMGELAAMTSASGLSAGGVLRRYARIQPVFSDQLLFGVTSRPSALRHDAYHPPNALAEIAHGGLRSSDCSNLRNAGLPTLGGAPPCRLQPGWEFQGLVRFYPHVEPAPAPK